MCKQCTVAVLAATNTDIDTGQMVASKSSIKSVNKVLAYVGGDSSSRVVAVVSSTSPMLRDTSVL